MFKYCSRRKIFFGGRSGFTPLEFLKNFFGVKRVNRKTLTGFTLIELLVAVAVFTIVVIVMADIFLISNNGLARIFSQQNVQDSARFMMESMAKDLRMSAVTTDSCSPCSSLEAVSYLDNPGGETLIYAFTGGGFSNFGSLTLRRSGQTQTLNSGKVKVTGAFYLNKTGLSPKVTIVMKVRGVETKVSRRGEIDLQTTISSHRY